MPVMPKTRRHHNLLLRILPLAVVGLTLATPIARAQTTYTWVAPLAGTGTWSTPANWSPAGPPGTGDIALFTNNGAFPSPGVDLPFTIGRLQFDSTAQTYQFETSGNRITLNAVSNIGLQDNSTTGQDFFNQGFALANNQQWFVAASGITSLNDQGNVTEVGGARTLTKTGPGTLHLSGVNTFTGGLIIQAGRVNLSATNSITQAPVTVNNGILQLGGNEGLATDNALGTGATIAPLTINQGGLVTTFTSTQHTLNNLTINGGTLTGVLQGNPNNYVLSGASVTINGLATSTINALAGVQLSGASTFDVGQNVSGGPDLHVASVLSGSGSISKIGEGVMRLGNAAGNNYSGGTTISGGTLVAANTTGSATGGGAVAVNAGVTPGVLSGTGSVGGAVNVNAGGRLSPGFNAANPAAPGPGQLRASGNVTYTDPTGNGSLAVALAGAQTAEDAGSNARRSQLAVTGSMTFANGMTVDVSRIGTFGTLGIQNNYTIATAATLNAPAAFTSVSLTTGVGGGGSATANGMTLSVSGFNSGDVFTLLRQAQTLVLQYTPVPEPAAALAVLAAGLGVASWRRRARRRGEPAVG